MESTVSVFEWHAGLAVGHPLIDRQHQGLLRLGARAIEILERPGNGRSEFHAVLNDLADALTEHFAAEEKVLAASRCPTLDAHRADHDVLRARLTEVLVLGTGSYEDKIGLLRTIEEWTVRHFVECDLACRAYLGAPDMP